MSRVLTFSRTFPGYHPRKGEPTYFVEKIYKSLYLMKVIPNKLVGVYSQETFENCYPKHHTIRSGHRWKVGDKFSPRVWSGKPYQSKQIIIAPDIEVKKVWDFDIEGSDWFIDGRRKYATTGDGFDSHKLATNDGLDIQGFDSWFTDSPSFNKSPIFNGQIICWNETVNY